VQAISAVALLKLGETEPAGPVLDRLVGADKELVRVTLATQLQGVRHDISRSVLTRLAGDATSAVARQALLGLEQNGDPALLPMVIEQLSGTDPDVIMAALDCLGNWGDPASANAITSLLDHDNKYVRLSAANAILEINARKAPAA
jgi:HEAT repeat protein